MKTLTIRYFFVALALVAVAGCVRKFPQEDTPEGNATEELTFTVRWGDAPSTRTVLQADGRTVWWTPDEYVKVFSNDMSGMFYSTNAWDADEIEIRGGLAPNNGSSGSVNGTYFALYPYDADSRLDPSAGTITFVLPSEQQGCEGTFADKMVPAVAKSNNFTFSFYNVCGGARFSVTEPGISSATFSSIGGEALAGKVCVGFNAQTGLPEIRSVVTGESSVTVNAPEGGFVPGEYYFVILFPGALQDGISVEFSKEADSRVLELQRTITVHRALFGLLDNLDAGLWNAPGNAPSPVASGQSMDDPDYTTW